MFTDRWRNRIGFLFFTAATALSLVGAALRPTLLTWLMVLYNLVLMGLYLKRRPARVYDRRGLWLGLIAIFLPLTLPPAPVPTAFMVVGLMGYALSFAALAELNTRYGLGAADRGLVTQGPYRLVRHPLYLGELVFWGAILIGTAGWGGAPVLIILMGIQALRALLEEKVMADYPPYAAQVPWRIIPLIW